MTGLPAKALELAEKQRQEDINAQFDKYVSWKVYTSDEMHFPLIRLWIELQDAQKHSTFPANVKAEVAQVFRYPLFGYERVRSEFDYEWERIAHQLHFDPEQPFPDHL